MSRLCWRVRCLVLLRGRVKRRAEVRLDTWLLKLRARVIVDIRWSLLGHGCWCNRGHDRLMSVAIREFGLFGFVWHHDFRVGRVGCL
jgi:hypothetical protein